MSNEDYEVKPYQSIYEAKPEKGVNPFAKDGDKKDDDKDDKDEKKDDKPAEKDEKKDKKKDKDDAK